jgi:hypothetical protein
MECRRCVLPASEPDISLDDEGLCSVCRTEDSAPAAPPLLEVDFVKMLNRAVRKAKGPYDCLVMCSGGKDSTAALHKIVRRYRLRPLAFTFDHGFEDPGAIENVRRAVEILGVDWVVHRSSHMHDLFAAAIRHPSPVPICPLCSLWYMELTYETAKRYGVPVIISGWTRGQMMRGGRSGNGQAEYRSMAEVTGAFIRQVRKDLPDKYGRFPLTMEEVIARNRKLQVLSPHWFLREDPSEYARCIAEELGWRPIPESYPFGSVNCRLNFVASHLTLKGFGFTHYHIEMSKLIRQGEMSRSEAVEALKLDIAREPVAAMVREVLGTLGCSQEDL